jgi:zinc-ribbon domain
MNLLIVITLGVILLVYVIMPLTKKKYQLAFVPFNKTNQKEIKLLERKNELLGALKEIEFEYQLGKLSEEDYNNLKNDYEMNALSVLKELDHKDNGNSEMEDIESEIREFRSKMKPGLGQENNLNYCSNCGAKLSNEFKFCSNCGKSLN